MKVGLVLPTPIPRIIVPRPQIMQVGSLSIDNHGAHVHIRFRNRHYAHTCSTYASQDGQGWLLCSGIECRTAELSSTIFVHRSWQAAPYQLRYLHGKLMVIQYRLMYHIQDSCDGSADVERSQARFGESLDQFYAQAYWIC